MIARPFETRLTSTKPAFSNALDRAVVGVRVGPAHLRVARVALERDALPALHVLRRGLEQRDGHALLAVRARDVEARHRPHGQVVDGLERARAREAAVLFARRDRDPAGGLAVDVRQQAGLLALRHEALERALVAAVLAAGRPLRARAAEEHAPAAAVRALRAEQRLEVGPALGGQRLDGDFHEERLGRGGDRFGDARGGRRPGGGRRGRRPRSARA